MILSNLVESEEKRKILLEPRKEEKYACPSLILLHGFPTEFLTDRQSLPLLLRMGSTPRLKSAPRDPAPGCPAEPWSLHFLHDPPNNIPPDQLPSALSDP